MEIKSLREAISLVRSNPKLQNKDEQIKDRAIASMLNDTALLFIKQITDKRKLWNSSNIFQVISCLTMQKVPLAECGGFASNCDISRSVVQLPKIAEGNNFGMLIQGVWSIDLISRRFIESTPDRFANSLGLDLPNNPIHFWIQEKYLYTGDPNIEKVKIAAYFEEDIPDSLLLFPDECNYSTHTGCCSSSTTENKLFTNSDCCPPNPYDLPFKCPGYLIQSVVDKAVLGLLKEYVPTQDITTTGIPESKK